ncbi:MAG: hypothetical protein ACLSVH_13415, partial [Gemmiger formicilis]
MILADFFALRQARRRLWAACKRICAGLTSILCTSRSGLHASSASAAAARCTAGCTAHRQLTAPSSTAALIYQRARPPALAPAANPQTSTAAAADTAMSRKKHRTGPSPSASRTASRAAPSRQPSPKHHNTSPSTAHGAGDGAIYRKSRASRLPPDCWFSAYCR